MADVYCIDSSSLIDMKTWYFSAAFRFVWDGLAKAVEDHRLIAPREVSKEIGEGNDELVTWCKAHSSMFIQTDPEEAQVLIQVLRECPRIVDPAKDHDADPMLIALALARCGHVSEHFDGQRAAVVTQENPTGAPCGSGNRVKIPDACRHFRLQCIKAPQMIVELGISAG